MILKTYRCIAKRIKGREKRKVDDLFISFPPETPIFERNPRKFIESNTSELTTNLKDL